MGYVGTVDPVESPWFGMAWHCLCQRERLQSAKLTGMIQNAGIPRVYDGFTLASFAAMPDKLQVARWVHDYIHNGLSLEWAGKTLTSLYLYGEPGQGKSTLAAIIARSQLDAGRPILWTDFNDLLNQIQRTYGKGESMGKSAYEIKQIVSGASFLVLDDLGDVERDRKSSDDRRDIAYDILRARRNDKLPTVITSNLTPEQLRAQFGQRISDRVHELCHEFQVAGGNFRYQ